MTAPYRQLFPRGPATGGGGATNWLPSVVRGLAHTLTLQAVPAVVRGLAASALAVVIPQPVVRGLSCTLLSSGTALPPVNRGISNGSVLTMQTPPATVRGLDVVQVTYDLVHTGPATAVAGTGSWTNPANAQGSPDGAYATNANTVTVAASGTLTSTHAAQPNRTALTITKVEVLVYGKYAGAQVGPGTWTVQCSLDGTNYTTLQSATTDFTNDTPNPKVYDVTAAVGGDWTKVAALKISVGLAAAAGVLPSTLSIDALAVRVTATRTDLN